jgi:hypothetical protein
MDGCCDYANDTGPGRYWPLAMCYRLARKHHFRHLRVSLTLPAGAA